MQQIHKYPNKKSSCIRWDRKERGGSGGNTVAALLSQLQATPYETFRSNKNWTFGHGGRDEVGKSTYKSDYLSAWTTLL